MAAVSVSELVVVLAIVERGMRVCPDAGARITVVDDRAVRRFGNAQFDQRPLADG